jgi:hypothetical protein
VGHALSCLLLRQMEFDADRYEARLAGAEAFAETGRQLLLLGLATDGALALAQDSWNRTGRLPDDLSTLIRAVSACISPGEFRNLEKELQKRKSGLFDTHPAHGERLASVRRENAAGVFHLEGPATGLFKDFPKLSRAVTLDFYRRVLGKRVRRDVLVPVTVFLGSGEGRGTPIPPENRR